MNVKSYTGRANINIYHGDCMEFMKDKPAKSYELCIVDPPYGIGMMDFDNKTRGKLAKAKDYKKINDTNSPEPIYFNYITDVTNNQIVWGANHFINKIPNANSSCWIVWDKVNGNSDFADCELAWTSYQTAVRKFEFRWHGMLQNDMKNKEIRQHPTQKPVALYKWLLQNYAKPNDKILDTHGGSMSIAIACWDLGFDLDIIELDKDYYDKAVERFERHINQKQLF